MYSTLAKNVLQYLSTLSNQIMFLLLKRRLYFRLAIHIMQMNIVKMAIRHILGLRDAKGIS